MNPDYLKIQEAHLANWKTRLKPSLYEQVARYVRKHNSDTVCYRGQDIIRIIETWPELIPGVYPPAVEADDVL